MASALALINPTTLMRRGGALVAGPCCCECCVYADLSVHWWTYPGHRTHATGNRGYVEIELSDGRVFRADSSDVSVRTGGNVPDFTTIDLSLAPQRCGESEIVIYRDRFSTTSGVETSGSLSLTLRAPTSFDVRVHVSYGGMYQGDARGGYTLSTFLSFVGASTVMATTMPVQSSSQERGVTSYSYNGQGEGHGTVTYAWHFDVRCA